MKTGRSLQEVIATIETQEKVKRDYVVPTPRMALAEDGATFSLTGAASLEPMRMTDNFHRQLGAATHIPAKYYDLMRENKPELLATNVNAWLGSMDNSYMVRTLDYPDQPVARALLSDRYRRVDNMQIASSVLPLFAGQANYTVASCEVTENRMYFKIVNHTLRAEVRVGDWVEGGLIISNSEVGLGSVSVMPFLNRLVCTNGMVVNDLAERRRHVGRANRAVENSFDIYSDETLIAEDRAFMLRLRDTCKAAIEEARFDKVVKTLQNSTEAKITGRVQEVVELTAQSYTLGQDEQEGILKYLIEGGDLSLYGLGNAITREAQDVASYDRATALEGVGWQVINMPAKQWAELNRA